MLVEFVGPTLRWTSRSRWDRIRTVSDFQRLARQRTPRSVFDYVDGAPEGERSMRRSTAAFDRISFAWHILRDVTDVDPETVVLGERACPCP